MSGSEDMNTTETKLDLILKAIESLSMRTNILEDFAATVDAKQRASKTSESLPTIVTSTTMLPTQALGPSPSTIKEPRVSLPEKFDGSRSKFRGFVNQVQLIIALQPQRYPTDESRVGLVGTLLSGQALSWFAPLFEARSPILSNFDTFLATFSEAFGEHDKNRWATTKIRALRQGSRSASLYASEFRQLACDINWGEEALVSQFQWGLRDDVKDLLLSFSDPQNLNEAISQAVKCDNRLFQRRQDRRSWNTLVPQRYAPSEIKAAHATHLPSQGPEDMQIDAVRFGPLTVQEKKRRLDEGLCLYCGNSGHKAINCDKKHKQRPLKTRSAHVSENEDAQSQ